MLFRCFVMATRSEARNAEKTRSGWTHGRVGDQNYHLPVRGEVGELEQVQRNTWCRTWLKTPRETRMCVIWSLFVQIAGDRAHVCCPILILTFVLTCSLAKRCSSTPTLHKRILNGLQVSTRLYNGKRFAVTTHDPLYVSVAKKSTQANISKAGGRGRGGRGSGWCRQVTVCWSINVLYFISRLHFLC
jgi:hypothetical protein